jgi:hypothetical protein
MSSGRSSPRICPKNGISTRSVRLRHTRKRWTVRSPLASTVPRTLPAPKDGAPDAAPTCATTALRRGELVAHRLDFRTRSRIGEWTRAGPGESTSQDAVGGKTIGRCACANTRFLRVGPKLYHFGASRDAAPLNCADLTRSALSPIYSRAALLRAAGECPLRLSRTLQNRALRLN